MRRRWVAILAVAAATTTTVVISGGARGASLPSLMISASADRSLARPLYGVGVAGPLYAFFAPAAGITKVAFYLDDPGRSHPARHVENQAPFDLAGGTAAAAIPVDTTQLANGTHTLTAAVTIGSTTLVSTASFDVANAGVWAAASTYKTAASQPYLISEAQAAAVGGKVYQFGGFDSTKKCCTETSRSYVYDPKVNTWTALAPMPGGGVTHAGATTDGRYVFLAGGYVPDSTGTQQKFGTRAVWRYDTVAGTWSSMPQLPATRSAGQLVWLDGRLHYFGGEDSSRTVETPDHWVLDVADGATAWTVAAPMPAARNHMGAVALGGLIYAIGGQTDHDGAAVVSDLVQVYDPTTDSWDTTSPLPLARSHIAASTFVQQGRIIVAGGAITGGFTPQREVDAYDPATDTWSTLTPLPGARMSMVAADLGGGQWLATGGEARNSYRVVPAA